MKKVDKQCFLFLRWSHGVEKANIWILTGLLILIRQRGVGGGSTRSFGQVWCVGEVCLEVCTVVVFNALNVL